MPRKKKPSVDGLKRAIQRWLPPSLMEGTFLPPSLGFERRIVLLCGPSGCGKSHFARSALPSFANFSHDHVQYTGPCHQRLVEARLGREVDKVGNGDCEKIGFIVQSVALREAIFMGADQVLEGSWFDDPEEIVPEGYELLEHIFLFRPFQEAWKNFGRRRKDASQTSYVGSFQSVEEYLFDHYLPLMSYALKWLAAGRLRAIDMQGDTPREARTEDILLQIRAGVSRLERTSKKKKATRATKREAKG